jgi:hypothetical protein
MPVLPPQRTLKHILPPDTNPSLYIPTLKPMISPSDSLFRSGAGVCPPPALQPLTHLLNMIRLRRAPSHSIIICHLCFIAARPVPPQYSPFPTLMPAYSCRAHRLVYADFQSLP